MESCMGELTQGGDGDHPRVEPCGGGCVQGAVAAYALQLQVDDRSRLARVCDMLAEDSLAMWMSCVQGVGASARRIMNATDGVRLCSTIGALGDATPEAVAPAMVALSGEGTVGLGRWSVC